MKVHHNFSWVACWGLAKRYLIRTRRSFKNVLVSLLTPIVMLLLFGPAMGNFTHITLEPGSPATIDYIAYFVPGIIALTMCSAALFSASTITQWDKFTRFEEIITLTPNTPSTLISGYALGGFIHTVVEVVIVTIITQFIVFPPAAFGWFFLYNIFAATLCSGTFLFLGIALARVLDWERYTLFLSVLTLPLVYLSSIFAPSYSFGQFSWIVDLNPLSVLLVGFRTHLIEPPPVTLASNFLLLGIYCLGSYAICAYLFNRTPTTDKNSARKSSPESNIQYTTKLIYGEMVRKLGMGTLEQIYHRLLENKRDEALSLFRGKFTNEEISQLFKALVSAYPASDNSSSIRRKQ